MIIEQLANVSIGNNDLTARFEEDDRKQSVSIVLDKSTLTISVKNYINVAAEIDRLTQELEGIDLRVASVEKRLADSKFLTNAPEEIVDKETEKHQTLKERSEKLAKLLAQLK